MNYSCGSDKQAGESTEHAGVGEGRTQSLSVCCHVIRSNIENNV